MTDAPVSSLADALRFSPADLDANRAGRLSDAQRDRLRRGERRATLILVGLVAGVMIGAALLVYLGGRAGSPILSVVGVSLTAVNAAVLAVFGGARLRVRHDLNSGRVEQVRGVVRRVVRVNNRIVNYVLALEHQHGTVRLSVSKAVFNAFNDGAAYRLYRTGMAKVLLAAENDQPPLPV